jgi:hypothetical protein
VLTSFVRLLLLVLCGFCGGWVCFACGVTLLYTVDDSDLQILGVWLWDRISWWSGLFAFAVSYQKLASVTFLV